MLVAVPGCPEQVPRGCLLRAGPGGAAEPGRSAEALPTVGSSWEQAGPGQTASLGAGIARYQAQQGTRGWGAAWGGGLGKMGLVLPQEGWHRATEQRSCACWREGAASPSQLFAAVPIV